MDSDTFNIVKDKFPVNSDFNVFASLSIQIFLSFPVDGKIIIPNLEIDFLRVSIFIFLFSFVLT